MEKVKTENTPNSKTIRNDYVLGFKPEWIDEATVGDDKSSNKKFIYKKIKDPLEIESNNYKRTLDVYFSSAESDDLDRLLNYLLPKNNK